MPVQQLIDELAKIEDKSAVVSFVYDVNSWGGGCYHDSLIESVTSYPATAGFSPAYVELT